jgi:hypothetical protein
MKDGLFYHRTDIEAGKERLIVGLFLSKTLWNSSITSFLRLNAENYE